MIAAIIIIILSAMFAYYFSDWRNWKLYHSTILYLITMNLTYELLTYHYTLWQYKPGLISSHTLTSMLTVFAVLPIVVLIYLTHFPTRGFVRKLLYISCWVLASTFIEWNLDGNFIYKHGWGLNWSFYFYWLQFLMIWIHFKKPLLAYALSVLCTVFFLVYFKVPLDLMK